MKLQDALEDLRIAFRQLEFGIKLLSFCDLEKIVPADFDTDHVVILGDRRLNFPTGNFSKSEQIIGAASIALLTAAGASAITLDEAFNAAGIKPDPTSSDNTAMLRVLAFMVRNAYAHGMADPKWVVFAKYQKTITINIGNTSPLVVDLAALNGQRFTIDQIGGYWSWWLIYQLAIKILTSSVEAAAS